MTIFQTSPDGLPAATNYACRIGWQANTIYRENPAVVTSSSSSSSSASPSRTSTVASSTTAPSTTAGSSTQSSTTQSSTSTAVAAPSTDDKSSSDKSHAWIAGVVIGPIVGCAILALIAWMWWKMSKKERQHGAELEGHDANYNLLAMRPKFFAGRGAQAPVELPSAANSYSDYKVAAIHQGPPVEMDGRTRGDAANWS